MRFLLVALAACHGAPKQHTIVTASPTGDIVIGGVMPPPVGPVQLAAAQRAIPATTVACPAPDLATAPPPPECTPHVVAPGSGGTLLRAFEFTSCQVGSERDDGAIEIATSAGIYLVADPSSPAQPIAKRSAALAIAAGKPIALFVADDGASGMLQLGPAHCEALPMPVVGATQIAGTSDGRILFWGRDTAGMHLVERTPDAVFHVFPPIRADNATSPSLRVQAGRAVAAYSATIGGGDTEHGYYDETDAHVHPIAREPAGASPVEYVAGGSPGEPPTAMFERPAPNGARGGTITVVLPDIETGVVRIEATRSERACGGGAYGYEPKPTATDFVNHTPPVLFRTAQGGLFVGFGEVRGTCTYAISNEYGMRAPARATGDPTLFAHPAPPPPMWRSTPHYKHAEITLWPIEHGKFGDTRHVELPARELRYMGPWNYQAAVTQSHVRLSFGDLFVDLDPAKLPAEPPLAHAWPAPAPETASVAAAATSPILALPVAPPDGAPALPPLLRTGERAALIALAADPAITIKTPPYSTCVVQHETATGTPALVRAVVLHCDQSRAIGIVAAPTDGRVAIAQFSQRGAEPYLAIDAHGTVVPTAVPATGNATKLRWEADVRRFAFTDRVPDGAPPLPIGWSYYDAGTATFATDFQRDGGALQRAKLVRGTWTFEPAFGAAAVRTPPKGPLMWPVFLPAAHGGDPTIVYVGDPRVTVDVMVRTSAGAYVAMATWPGATPPEGYRVSEVSAIDDPTGAALPVVTAKVDGTIIVGIADGGAYHERVLAGAAKFPADVAPPPGASRTPVRTPHGLACSEQLAGRDREEVFSPHVFAWPGGGAGLGYLSVRVHEQLRWTVVPAREATGCNWVVDSRTESDELAIARLDVRKPANGAREVLRVPVEFRPGNGFHGAGLVVAAHGNLLDAVATSYGVDSYVRLDLGKL